MPNHNRFGIERNRKQNHEDKHGETHNERVEWVIMISLSRRVGRPQWDDWGERGRDFRQKLEPLKNVPHGYNNCNITQATFVTRTPT